MFNDNFLPAPDTPVFASTITGGLTKPDLIAGSKPNNVEVGKQPGTAT